MRLGAFAVLLGGVAAMPQSASGADQIGTSFPKGFPVIRDASLGAPVIGFPSSGKRHANTDAFLSGR